jgi:LmbE family N-acetylglucosaminyl deacetylase
LLWAASDRVRAVRPTGRPAVVFAPHPDDETLGCGGTTLLKRLLGADVTVVLATDGGASNPDRMPPEQLRPIRVGETYAATALLDVPPERVVLWNYPDGALAANADDAVERAAGIIEASSAVEVFVCHRLDPHPDHAALYSVVKRALMRCAREVTLFEYPIWLLHHWPACGETPRGAALIGQLRIAARAYLDLNVSVDISAVRERKRKAVAAHETQVTNYRGDPQWRSLADIDGGEFLACFFRRRERFRRSSNQA